MENDPVRPFGEVLLMILAFVSLRDVLVGEKDRMAGYRYLESIRNDGCRSTMILAFRQSPFECFRPLRLLLRRRIPMPML
jgi:hypothetical protein